MPRRHVRPGWRTGFTPPMTYFTFLAWLGLATLAARAATAASSPVATAGAVAFNRDIRPILSDNCFACHGPDSAKRKAKLRLDTREGLFAGRDGKAIVKPGHPDQSDLARRIATADEDDLMPPPKSGKSLTKSQIALLQRWIAEGASWEAHWAYQAVRRPAVPEVKQPGWPKDEIDGFILARIEKEGLAPSPEADRRSLIRRLSFDLTGLPPLPEEVRAFEQDPSPAAYDQLVERLLASPHFGERLAMYWLDLVRYADTDGYHADNYRSVWPYRDYVIRAFNANEAFDRFTVEQLAGDLLPDASLEQRVASTYNRLGRSTEEGGAQPKEYLAKYAADRARSVGTVWLAATTGCAECHDHKFDPITTRDFYRLEAYFADLKEAGVGKREGSLVPSPEQAADLQRLEGHIAGLEATLTNYTPQLAAAQVKWAEVTAADLAAGQPAWAAVKPEQVVSAGGATLTVLEDRSVLSGGANPDNDTYTVTLRADQPHLTAIELEALTHPTMKNGGLSRANGNFVLTEVEVEAAKPGEATATRVELASAIADFSQDGYPVANAIDGKSDTGWAVAGHEKPADHQAAFIFAQPLAGGPGTVLTVRLKFESSFKQHAIGRFRLSITSVDHPALNGTGLPTEVAEALRRPLSERTPEQMDLLKRHFLAVTPLLDKPRAELVTARKEREALVARIPTTLMSVTEAPRITRILPRGNWMNESGDIVEPAPPEFLGGAPLKDRRATRLDLARWLVSRENPLTARVFVNRLWKLLFGVGISKSLDDFGVRGEWPTHPELLDWLAAEFMDSGWDVKHIVRLMVRSRAYRQSSQESEELRERDPFNRLYARQARFRIDAEMVRDNALSVAGLLVERIGGPSVKPYQPAGYWDQLNFPKRTWDNDTGESLYRRGLYTFWCRTFLQPSLLAFDACPREESTAERMPSNTPLQALALLNDPTYVEAARVFAARVLRGGGSDTNAAIDRAFDQALARKPTAAEREVLAGLLRAELQRFSDHPESASQFLAEGAAPVPADLKASELAAWTEVTRAILNLHETIERF